MPGALTPIEIFCSYAHEDKPRLRDLEVQLHGLKRQELISIWHDGKIDPGIDEKQAIDTHLENASLILLLVSPDFLASGSCCKIVQRAMQRHNAKEARVIPIIVRPCEWSHAPFARLSCRPRDGKPVTTWENPDDAWLDVTTAIGSLIDEQLLRSSGAAHDVLSSTSDVPSPLTAKVISSLVSRWQAAGFGKWG